MANNEQLNESPWLLMSGGKNKIKKRSTCDEWK